MTARFITAPDRLPEQDAEEEHQRVLIVDSEWHDIESIALLCMTRNVKYDFFLFGPTSIDKDWLDNAANEADTILINNTSERHLDVKDRLSKLEKSISMGANGDVFKAPMDFIVKQIETE